MIMTHLNPPFPFCLAKYGIKRFTKIAPIRLMANPALIVLGVNLVMLS